MDRSFDTCWLLAIPHSNGICKGVLASGSLVCTLDYNTIVELCCNTSEILRYNCSYSLITNVIGLLSTVRLVSDVTNLDLTIPYHFIA